MKSRLLLLLLLCSTNVLASDWLCINNIGIEQEACLSITNPKSCNNQGEEGLDCFWHFNRPDLGGACYSEDPTLSNTCSVLDTSYSCEGTNGCHWSGQSTPIDPYEPEPIGVCAQIGSSSAVTCGSLDRSSCQWESSCTWVEL